MKWDPIIDIDKIPLDEQQLKFVKNIFWDPNLYCANLYNRKEITLKMNIMTNNKSLPQ